MDVPLHNDDIQIIIHLISALIGGIIGLERSFHGRPARFRTHALVPGLQPADAGHHVPVTLDTGHCTRNHPHCPTHGPGHPMTGIGFLGARVIFKEGLSVRGLTTAASIWITAAIGILMGIGFTCQPFCHGAHAGHPVHFSLDQAHARAFLCPPFCAVSARNEVMPEPQFKTFWPSMVSPSPT